MHNASFDLSFLRRAVSRRNRATTDEPIRLPTRLKTFDTLELTRIVLPGMKSYSLSALSAELNCPARPDHRALADCRATGWLFSHLLDRILQLPESTLKRLIGGIPGRASPLKKLFRESLKLVPDRPLGDRLLPDNCREEKGPKPEMTGFSAGFATKYLGEEGPLPGIIQGYEQRSGQIRMSETVAETLAGGGTALIEAGTGIGKSFAYLLPALQWAAATDERVVVSTHTRHLQDQLFYKDLPMVAELLKVPFRAVLLKGRSNYLCLSLWADILQGRGNLNSRDRQRLLPVITWLEITASGDIEENPALARENLGRLWRAVSADNPACPGSLCSFYQQCFLYRARRKAASASLVVVNHALALIDLIRDGGILGAYHNIVFDEAHQLEKAAIDAVTRSVSPGRFRALLDSVTRSVDERLQPRIKPVGVLAQHFFELQALSLRERLGETSYPRFRYTPDSAIRDLVADWAPVAEALAGLADALEELKSESGGTTNRDGDRERVGLEGLIEDVKTLISEGDFLMKGDADDYVFWLEADRSFDPRRISLQGAPLQVAEELRSLVFDPIKTVILTSATLSDGRGFDHMKQNLGLDADSSTDLSETIIPSPFDYSRQLKAAVIVGLPDPRNQPEYAASLSAFLLDLLRSSPRRTMALFTSHELMRKVAATLRRDLTAGDLVVLVQGIDGSRQALLSRFRALPGSLLMGTDSFWEGIDLPGDHLEQLVITRLPFPVPAEPWNQAAIQWLENIGRDGFRHFMIPRAVLKLRQGLGRLIRNRNDKGLIVFTDRRMTTTGYGSIFAKSLPVPLIAVEQVDQLLSVGRKWWLDKEIV
jgi:predicted DnaQ family exonuclease/DinG family helicase